MIAKEWDGSGKSQDAIRQDIEQTRVEMAGTLEALQRRLTPAELKHRAGVKIREVAGDVRAAAVGKVEDMAHRATDSVKEARGSFVETIRQNPIPAAMAGAGLIWLFMNRKSASRPQIGSTRDERIRVREGTEEDWVPPPANEESPSVAQRAKERIGSVAYETKEAAGNIVHEASDKAVELKHRATDTATHLAHRAQSGAHRAQDQFGQMMQDNPLVLGAIALAVGTAVGLALPRTRKEDQLMGGARDQLLDKAGSAASQAMDKVQQAADTEAQKIQSAVQESAQK